MVICVVFYESPQILSFKIVLMNTYNEKREIQICKLVVAVCYKFVFLIAILSFEFFSGIIVMNIKFAVKVLRCLKM